MLFFWREAVGNKRRSKMLLFLLPDTEDTRLQAVFSPALSDYLAMDPTRLLPITQYPVWNGGKGRWVIPGFLLTLVYQHFVLCIGSLSYVTSCSFSVMACVAWVCTWPAFGRSEGQENKCDDSWQESCFLHTWYCTKNPNSYVNHSISFLFPWGQSSRFSGCPAVQKCFWWIGEGRRIDGLRSARHRCRC